MSSFSEIRTTSACCEGESGGSRSCLFILLRFSNPRCCVTAKIDPNTGMITGMNAVKIHNHEPALGGEAHAVLTARSKWLRRLRDDPDQLPMDVIVDEREK